MIRKTVALYFKRAVPLCDKKDLSHFVLKNCRTLFLLKKLSHSLIKGVAHCFKKKNCRSLKQHVPQFVTNFNINGEQVDPTMVIISIIMIIIITVMLIMIRMKMMTIITVIIILDNSLFLYCAQNLPSLLFLSIKITLSMFLILAACRTRVEWTS